MMQLRLAKRMMTLSAALLVLRPAPEAAADAIRSAIDDVVRQVGPALVQIHVVNANYRRGREIKNEAAGSGVIITKEGHVLSNHHVAGNATRIVCTLMSREEIEAELVGTDPLSDIAVLQLLPDTAREFPVAEFGNSDDVAVGDRVLALGSPMALSQSVTLGIVSNTRMVMPKLFWPFNRFRLDGEDVGLIVRWLGHDAAIYGGNSGGPLVNLQGEIVGINEIRLGLSGAIPSNLARDVAEELMAHGSVTRAWLGFDMQPLFKHSDHNRGVLVSGTLPDSPAKAAGFQPGDILREIGGRPVTVRFQEDLPLFNQWIASLPIGEPVEATVLRGDETKTLQLTPVERERMQPKTEELKPWGLTARNISLLAAQELKLPTRDGVLVTSVRVGGPAGSAKPALQETDIIETVNHVAVTNMAALKRVTHELTEGHSKPVPTLVGFKRDTEDYITVVEVGISALQVPPLEAKKAWVPADTQVITRELAEHLGRPDLKGVRVTQVYPGTTAERDGLQVGDLILAIDSEPIPASQPMDYETFPAMVRQYDVGARPALTVLRDGEERKVAVELIRAPKLVREMKKYRDELFEFTARDISFFDRVDEQWQSELKGVVVSEVIPGGWAALAHLAADDLIQQVDGQPVQNVTELERLMDEVADKKPPAVVFQVLRGIHTRFLELEPNWPEHAPSEDTASLAPHSISAVP